eukprot:4312409-Pyramimonas_sp.AAC.1
MDDPSSDGDQPDLRILPGVGPRRNAKSFEVGAPSPWNATAAAAAAGPLERGLSAGFPRRPLRYIATRISVSRTGPLLMPCR